MNPYSWGHLLLSKDQDMEGMTLAKTLSMTLAVAKRAMTVLQDAYLTP